MNHEQINLIRRSFEKISPDAFAKSFYNHLFSIQPTLRLLFPDDFGERRQDLILMLEAAIERLDEPEKLIPALEESGRRRALHGMRAGHYKPFGTALFASLRETLPANFTGETEAAWTKLYEVMSETMKRGARGLSGASAQNQSQINRRTEMKINRRTEMKNYIRYFWASILAMLLTATAISAAPLYRSASGANAAAISGAILLFGFDLGGTNNGVGGSYRTGRREINWDDIPDNLSAPNHFSGNYYNSNSPRGAVISTPCNSGFFTASARQGSGTPPRFGNYNPSASFTTNSAERLFNVEGRLPRCNILTVNFFIPGTDIPATVSGFGAVFTDVDFGYSAGSRAYFYCYDAAGRQLAGGNISPGAANSGLSFIGVSFPDGERIARVEIISGNANIGDVGVIDGEDGIDLVVMDDFIYGEPRASQFHSNDFDGDGAADSTVFRPSTGDWYTLQSGSNTARIDHFGGSGDVPVNGDFDGDKLADTAIYRPSNGQWWFKRSTNGTSFAATFGTTGDKPVPGDYDRDGKTDFAVFRPSTNNWFVLRSSDNFGSFYSYPFGAAGDIPVGAAVYP